MREQFWGLLWGWSTRLLGAKHPLSLRLESRWSTAYWSAQPSLGMPSRPPLGNVSAIELDGLSSDAAFDAEGPP